MLARVGVSVSSAFPSLPALVHFHYFLHLRQTQPPNDR